MVFRQDGHFGPGYRHGGEAAHQQTSHRGPVLLPPGWRSIRGGRENDRERAQHQRAILRLPGLQRVDSGRQEYHDFPPAGRGDAQSGDAGGRRIVPEAVSGHRAGRSARMNRFLSTVLLSVAALLAVWAALFAHYLEVSGVGAWQAKTVWAAVAA